jgi:hypothetical protein
LLKNSIIVWWNEIYMGRKMSEIKREGQREKRERERERGGR